MSRLPTVGGDGDSWGTVLNDYLTETAGVATLATSPSAGAQSFDLAVIPPGLKAGSIIAVDTYTTQCELFAVASVNGTTVSISPYRCMFAHAAGDTVLVLDGHTTPQMYGLLADGSDEWQPLQRLILESRLFNQIVTGGGIIYFGQPLLVDTSSRWERLQLRTRGSFAPIETTGAAVMVGNGSFWFTAEADNDTFTSTASDHSTVVNHGLSVDITICFNAPYGETLPGGITPGKVYYVKSAPTASTFTITETYQGATKNITSDGTGWSINNPGDGLARVHWEGVYMIVTDNVNLNGMRMALQQPAWIRNMRLDMGSSATTEGGATGLIVTGQQSYLENMEINTWVNCIGLHISGTGHVVKGFNSVGGNNGDIALKLQGDSLCVYGLWTESHEKASVEIADMCRGASIDGAWIVAHQSAGIPCLLVTSNQTSYELAGIVRHTSGQGLFIKDESARNFELSQTTDVFHGATQDYGTTPPRLKVRFEALGVTTTPYAPDRAIRFISVNTAGGNKTVSLPTAVGWAGWDITIVNAPDSGSNTVTIDADGTELIDLTETKVLAPYESMTLVSNGSRYLVLDHRLPAEHSLPAYTPTNVDTDRSFDAATVAVAELADVVGTLIADLQARKIIG